VGAAPNSAVAVRWCWWLEPAVCVVLALANKMARIAFAIMRGKTTYREIPARRGASW
jgi:hypothetical protein